MKQFDIYWVQFPEPIGRRPALILTRTSALTYLNKAIVAEVTSTIRDIPVEVPVGKREGLKSRCVVTLENLQAVTLSRLRQRIGELPKYRHAEVKRALGFVLQWPELQAIET